jgi:branched-chain amino acid transport system permease protein
MYLVNRTKLGRAMRATAENPRVAALMGVRPDMVISATFIIGAIAGRGRRRDVGGQLRHGAAHHGLPARPEGLHGGGASAASATWPARWSGACCWA